jgi:hypothetical protein
MNESRNAGPHTDAGKFNIPRYISPKSLIRDHPAPYKEHRETNVNSCRESEFMKDQDSGNYYPHTHQKNRELIHQLCSAPPAAHRNSFLSTWRRFMAAISYWWY